MRMQGPEQLSDDELLRRAFNREDDLERTVRELEQSASELEQERDQAREAASVGEEEYRRLETAYRRERTAHDRTRRVVRSLSLTAAVLVISVLVRGFCWRRGGRALRCRRRPHPTAWPGPRPTGPLRLRIERQRGRPGTARTTSHHGHRPHARRIRPGVSHRHPPRHPRPVEGLRPLRHRLNRLPNRFLPGGRVATLRSRFSDLHFYNFAGTSPFVKALATTAPTSLLLPCFRFKTAPDLYFYN